MEELLKEFRDDLKEFREMTDKKSARRNTKDFPAASEVMRRRAARRVC